MNFAVIPWINEYLDDRLFAANDGDTPAGNIYYDMYQYFYGQGDEIHTIDKYKDLREVDYFLLFDLNWRWVNEIIKKYGPEKMIYCNAEPPSVYSINSPEGYDFLAQFFPYILTWNRDWVDNQTIFRRNIPYYFQNEINTVPYTERKLITGISGNKHSKHKDELYSERERVYSFFEEKYSDQFTFYGTGWNKKEHPCYGGVVKSKKEIFERYRFAICFENIKNVKDYVTEKIWDCLCCGIVPIYAGAENIDDYIPRECYIDYFEFENCEELAQRLIRMGEEEYQQYLDAAQKLLGSNIKELFSGAEYARSIYSAISHKKVFEVLPECKKYASRMCLKSYFSLAQTVGVKL